MKMALGVLIAAQLLATPAAMDITTYAEPENIIEYGVEGEEQTREEVLMWFYRMHNGIQQKRLWSVTYGYWITDWIDC